VVKCPKCGSENVELVKSWELAPRGRKPVKVGLFKCQQCGAFFRKGIKE